MAAKDFIIRLLLDSDVGGGKKVEDALGRISQKVAGLETFGKSMSMYFTAPLVAFGTLAAKLFTDFEAQMSRVGAISAATAGELKALTAQARELGATTRFSASDAANAMSYLAMSGFSVSEMTRSMPSVLQLAAAATLDMGTAANITSNILRGFGLDVGELAHANDVLVKAFTSSNTDLRQLGDAMKYVAPVARSSGQSIEDITAAVGALGNAGLQGTMAGTALRKAISSLVKPSRDAQKVLAELGVDTKDASGKMRPILDIISDLGDAGISTEQIFRIFGDRAAAAVAALTDMGGDSLKRFSDALKDSAGTTERIAKQQEDNLRGAFFQIKSAVEEAQIAVESSSLGKALREVVMQAYDLVSAFNASDDKTKRFAASVGLAVAAIGPAIFAATRLVAVFGTMSRVFVSTAAGLRALSVAFTSSAGAATAATIALRAFRGALAMTGVGALAVGLGYLADKFISSAEAAGRARSAYEQLPPALRAVQSGVAQVNADMRTFAAEDATTESVGRLRNYFEQVKTEYERHAQMLDRADKREQARERNRRRGGDTNFAKGAQYGEGELAEFESRSALFRKIQSLNTAMMSVRTVLSRKEAELESRTSAEALAREAADRKAFETAARRTNQIKRAVALEALSDTERKIEKERDLRAVEEEIAKLKSDAGDTSKSFADRAKAYDMLGEKLRETAALRGEIARLEPKAANEEKKRAAAETARLSLEILQAQARGDNAAATKAQRRLDIEREILNLKESANLSDADAREIATAKVEAEAKIEADKLARERNMLVVEAQISALKASGKKVEAEALSIRKRATEYAERFKTSYSEALADIKKIDDIQKKQKPATANKNARYGASVGQMERQQNKIKELLGSDSRADISRGAKMAERFEKRYGISINDDVREYKGIDRKTGKFVNPTSKEAVAQSDAENSQKAYGIAARAGAIKTSPDVVRPIAGAVGSAASAAVGAVSETAGRFSTGGVPAPRVAKSYSARMTEKAAGAADEFSTGGVPAPRSAKSFSERLAESRAPKSAHQKTQSVKASGKSGDSEKGAGGGIDEAVSSLSEIAKQIDTLVKKIIDLEKNVKGSVSRLSKK